MSVRIEQIDWRQGSDTLLSIRHRVFVEEQGVPLALEHDAEDAHALHLLAYDESAVPVGTARILGDGHIGRMAVLPAWRGRGIGTGLLQRLLRIATARGDRAVFLHAQVNAVAFYRRLGFIAEGEVFVDAGIDHQGMRLTLPGDRV